MDFVQHSLLFSKVWGRLISQLDLRWQKRWQSNVFICTLQERESQTDGVGDLWPQPAGWRFGANFSTLQEKAEQGEGRRQGLHQKTDARQRHIHQLLRSVRLIKNHLNLPQTSDDILILYIYIYIFFQPGGMSWLCRVRDIHRSYFPGILRGIHELSKVRVATTPSRYILSQSLGLPQSIYGVLSGSTFPRDPANSLSHPPKVDGFKSWLERFSSIYSPEN